MGSLKWTHQKPHKTNMMVIHMTTGDESKLNNKFVYTNIKNFWKYNPNFQPKVIDGYWYFSHTHIVLLQKTDSSTLVVWITIMLTCHVFRSVNFRDLLHFIWTIRIIFLKIFVCVHVKKLSSTVLYWCFSKHQPAQSRCMHWTANNGTHTVMHLIKNAKTDEIRKIKEEWKERSLFLLLNAAARVLTRTSSMSILAWLCQHSALAPY